jgi:hypothetical protein
MVNETEVHRSGSELTAGGTRRSEMGAAAPVLAGPGSEDLLLHTSEGQHQSVLDAILEQVRQAVVERAQEPEALVLRALFDYCHDKESSDVLVGQIASRVNACRKKIGEEADLKPRAVGSILKSLGLATDKIDSFGRGLRLSVQVKQRIHELLQSYDLVATDAARVAGCPLCEERMRR